MHHFNKKRNHGISIGMTVVIIYHLSIESGLDQSWCNTVHGHFIELNQTPLETSVQTACERILFCQMMSFLISLLYLVFSFSSLVIVVLWSVFRCSKSVMSSSVVSTLRAVLFSLSINFNYIWVHTEFWPVFSSSTQGYSILDPCINKRFQSDILCVRVLITRSRPMLLFPTPSMLGFKQTYA